MPPPELNGVNNTIYNLDDVIDLSPLFDGPEEPQVQEQVPPQEGVPADNQQVVNEMAQVDNPPLLEALTNPRTASEKILADPLGLTQQIEEKLAARPKKFSLFEKVLTVVTLGIAAPFINKLHKTNSEIERAEGESLRSGVVNLQQMLRNMPQDNQVHPRQIEVGGLQVSITQHENRTLTATIRSGGQERTVRLPLSASQLSDQLELDMARNANLYGKNALENVLRFSAQDTAIPEAPDPNAAEPTWKEDTGEGANSALSLTRRSVLISFIQSQTGKNNAEFSMMDTRELRSLAFQLHSIMEEDDPAKTPQSVYENFMTAYNERVNDQGKEKINSVLVSDLLNKLDSTEKPENQANVSGLKAGEREKIEKQRSHLESKQDELRQAERTQQQVAQTKIGSLKQRSGRYNLIAGFDLLARDLIGLKPGQAPGQSIMTLLAAHRGTLAELVANPMMIETLPAELYGKVHRLLDFCSGKLNGEKPVTIDKLFPDAVPPEKITQSFLFMTSEKDNPDYQVYLDARNALAELETQFTQDPMRPGLLLGTQMQQAFDAAGTLTLDNLAQIMGQEQNRELLVQIKNAPEALKGLNPIARDFVTQLLAANPDLAEPLFAEATAPAALRDSALKLTDMVNLPKLAQQMLQLRPNPQDPGSAYRQAAELYKANLPMLLRLSNYQYHSSILKQLEYRPGQEAAHRICTAITNGVKPESAEQFVQVLDRVAQLGPNAKEEQGAPLAHQINFLSRDFGSWLKYNPYSDLSADVAAKFAAGELDLNSFKDICRTHSGLLASVLTQLPNIYREPIDPMARHVLSIINSVVMANVTDVAMLAAPGAAEEFIKDFLAVKPEHMTETQKAQLDESFSLALQQMWKPVSLGPACAASILNEDQIAEMSDLQYKIENEPPQFRVTLQTLNTVQNNIAGAQQERNQYERSLEQKAVHNFVADLVLNFDASKFDSTHGNAAVKPGTRIANTLVEHFAAFNRMLTDPAALNTLPEQMRGPLKEAIGLARGSLFASQLRGTDGWAAAPADGAEESAQAKAQRHDKNLVAVQSVLAGKQLPLEDMKNLLAALHQSGDLTAEEAETFSKAADEALKEGALEPKPPFKIATKTEGVGYILQGGLIRTMIANALAKPAENSELWAVFAQIETQIDTVVEQAADAISEIAAEQFGMMMGGNAGQPVNPQANGQVNPQAPGAAPAGQAPVQGANPANAPAADQQLDATNPDVTLKQLLDKTLSNFQDTALGKFMQAAMQRYFADLSSVDKRSMIASMIRFSSEGMSTGQILGAIFKGAGPIMQKMLQRIPAMALPPELRSAIKDMKSNLAPIPDRVVQAHLLEMVKNSDQIDKIEVVRSLGAASVGQAILCKFYTKENPEGVIKVVKLLRPDVQNRVQRECDIFREAAKEVPGMEATFENDLKTILEELDLTVEANNVVNGQIYSGQGPQVKSMTLSKLVPPSTDTMVLDLAPGTTLDSLIEETHESTLEMVKPWTGLETNGVFMKMATFTGSAIAKRGDTWVQQPMDVGLSTYDKLSGKLDDLLKRQKMLTDFTKTWVTEGIFGKGFYHADLHAGNIMTDKNQLTIIDFGNSTQLTEDQQANIIKMMAAAMFGDGGAFTDSLTALLSQKSLDRLGEHVDKNNPNTPLVRDELRRVISAVLNKGEQKDAGSRILVALQEVMRLGVEMPGPIYNFSKCQMALSNAIDELNAEIASVSEAMRLSAFEVQGRPQQDPVTRLMKHVGAGPSEDKLEPALAELNRHVNDALDQLGKEEYGQSVREWLSLPADNFNPLKAYGAMNETISSLWQTHRDYTEQVAQLRKVIQTLSADEQEQMKPATQQKIAQFNDQIQALEMTLADIETDLIDTLRTFSTEQINKIAETARKIMPTVIKSPDDFIDCMGEVLKQKKDESISKMGFGKMIQYGIQSIFV